VSACQSLDSDLAVALDQALTRAQVAEIDVATLLERIAFVTGVDLSTEPTTEAVAAGLAVLDSLKSPVGERDGWYWNDPDGRGGGPHRTQSDAEVEISAELEVGPSREGHFIMCVREGQALAPMYCAPTRGSN
jgi:hypothetical protein